MPNPPTAQQLIQQVRASLPIHTHLKGHTCEQCEARLAIDRLATHLMEVERESAIFKATAQGLIPQKLDLKAENDSLRAQLSASEAALAAPEWNCPATVDQHNEDARNARIAALESELAATRKELEDTRRELEVARIMAMTDEEIRQDCEARGTTVEAEAAKVREVFDKAIQAFRQRGKTGEGTE